MSTTVAERVATRFAAKDTTKTASVIHKALGITWGWLSSAPARMHLVPIDDEHRQLGAVVWLEDQGTRAFDVEQGDELPPGAIDGLRSWTTTNRTYVERRWVDFMQLRHWLKLSTFGIGITVTAYPEMKTEISRDVDLSICPCWITNADVGIEDGMLVIGVGREAREQTRIMVNRIIWEGNDDGSDAGSIPF